MTGLPDPADVAAAARVADLLAAAALIGRPFSSPGRDGSKPKDELDQLHLVFLLSRAEAGGGAGVLLEHADQLARLGLRVTVLSHFPEPSWFPLAARYQQVPFGEPIEDAIPACDLIIAGYWEFVLPARQVGIAPVVHLEQGDFHLYQPVPDQLDRLVRHSLRAAQATLALGEEATRALATRYGVEAICIEQAVDTDVFTPGAPEPAAMTADQGQRDRVVIVGWDPQGLVARQDLDFLAARLRARHPELQLVPVCSSPPEGPVPGEVLVAPDQKELLELYRSARVCVVCSREAASGLAPLKAMAAGLPVVATATAGARAVLRDGENALVAEIGDLEGLCDRIERLLGDPSLARRLGRRARATAEQRAWREAAPALAERYRALAVPGTTCAGLGPFDLDLGGVQLLRCADADRLSARLATCSTQELAIPVAQPIVFGHRLYRWRVVARRSRGEPGVTKVHLPAKSEVVVSDSPYQAGIEALRRHRPVEALRYFVQRCEHAARREQAVLGRWIVLALLGAGRAEEAADVAVAFSRDFASHPDYLYLGVVAQLAARRPVDITGPLEGIRLLGPGARYDEWFEDPGGLLLAHLAAA